MRIVDYNEVGDEFFKYKEIEESSIVNEIVKEVKEYGDKAVKKWERKLDNVQLDELRVFEDEIELSKKKIDRKFRISINVAIENLRRFAKMQLDQFRSFKAKISRGVKVEQRVIPIERVGIYVPAGRYPLVSSLLMCAVPAKVASVREIIICSPPLHSSRIHPAILYAAARLNIKEIYKIGGAQAIAAMGYGTESIKKVDKIVGPGNKYVTLAKKLIYGATGIDFIAGPTEIMIIADKNANAEYVAADLLAQAEHDEEATAILVTDSIELAHKVNAEIDKQLPLLSTKSIAESSLNKNGLIIIVNSLKEAAEIANRKAPEHLELHFQNPRRHVSKFKNYGSLFIGEYSVEALGDYTSGLNHTLPTNMAARYTSGLSVKDFVKLNTALEVTKKGLLNLATATTEFSHRENLAGHANSILIRKSKINS